MNVGGMPAPTGMSAVDANGLRSAAGRSNELAVHVKGAVTNGCSAEQIQEILLLVAMYCGIPAANEAHRVAVDVLRENGIAP